MDTIEFYVLKIKNLTYNSAAYISCSFVLDTHAKNDNIVLNTFKTESYSLISNYGFCNKEDAIWFVDNCRNMILDFISNYNTSHLDQLGNEITLVKFVFTKEKEELNTFKLED